MIGESLPGWASLGRRLRAAPTIAVCAALGCLDPTQATVRITTDAPCAGPDRATGTLFTTKVGASAESVRMREGANTETQACDDGEIGSVVLYPRSDAAHANVVVVGVLGDADASTCAAFADGASPTGDGCVVARRRIAFVEHQPLEVPVVLYAACAGVRCAEGSTCEPGAPLDESGQPCVSAEVRCGADGRCPLEMPPAGAGGAGTGGAGAGGAPPSGPFVLSPVPTDGGARHVFGLDDGGAVYVSRAHQDPNGELCVTVEELEGGNTSVGTHCDTVGEHQHALHVIGAGGVDASADLGSAAVVVGATPDVLASVGSDVTDVFLRDAAFGYVLVGGSVYGNDRSIDLSGLVVDSDSTLGAGHLWILPGTTPADDRLFLAGPAACLVDIGAASCALPQALGAQPGVFQDVWGAGGRVALVTELEVVTLDAADASLTALAVEAPPAPSPASLSRVFSVEPAGTVWVAGQSGGALYVARGTPAGAGHTWEHAVFSTLMARPTSLWARASEAFVVVDGAVYRIEEAP